MSVKNVGHSGLDEPPLEVKKLKYIIMVNKIRTFIPTLWIQFATLNGLRQVNFELDIISAHKFNEKDL